MAQAADEMALELAVLVAATPEAEIAEMLRDELTGLILSFADIASVVASEWYDEIRADLDIPGSFSAPVVDLRDPGIDSLVGWAEDKANSTLSMVNLVEGGARRRVTNGARQTVAEAVGADPRARGIQRYARTSGGCAFCRMLAGRGAVYRSAGSASFAAHDSCRCVAVPAFDSTPLLVRPYTPSDRDSTEADRARVRAWLADQ